MRRTRKESRASCGINDVIVCPVCEIGDLQAPATAQTDAPVRCSFCNCAVGLDVLETLLEIVALPDAVGAHACECGHPEMRLLPDGVYRCPACGSEVLPVGGRTERGARSPRRDDSL